MNIDSRFVFCLAEFFLFPSVVSDRNMNFFFFCIFCRIRQRIYRILETNFNALMGA